MHGGWWVWLQTLFVASVGAPVVEETMFRGVLYRHLRDALGGLGTAASIAVSATLISFLFAVIHPQGVLATTGAAAGKFVGPDGVTATVARPASGAAPRAVTRVGNERCRACREARRGRARRARSTSELAG